MEFLDSLSKYWSLVLGGLALVSGWVTLRAQNNDQERRLSKLEGNVEAMNPIFLQIQKDLVEIRTTVKFIDQKVSRL